MVVHGPPIQMLDLMAESADLTLEPDDDSGCYMGDVEKGAVLASTDLLASLLLPEENRTRVHAACVLQSIACT